MTTKTPVVPSPPAEPALVDIGRVARTLGCSVRHVHRLRDAGKMPRPVRLGGLLRWNRAEVDRWVAAGCPAVK